MALADGSVRRTSEPLGGAVFAAPTLAGEVLVVATTAGVVHGLQAATLAPLWRKAGAPVFAQPWSTRPGHLRRRLRRGPRGVSY